MTLSVNNKVLLRTLTELGYHCASLPKYDARATLLVGASGSGKTMVLDAVNANAAPAPATWVRPWDLLDCDTAVRLWGSATKYAKFAAMASLAAVGKSFDKVSLDRATRGLVFHSAADPTAVPLQSLGSNAVLVLSTVLRMSAIPGGMVLMESAGSGLHYSVHQGFWSAVLNAVRLNNLRLVATCYDYDSLRGFAAADVDSKVTRALVRLERNDTVCRAVHIDQQALAVVAERDLEVR